LKDDLHSGRCIADAPDGRVGRPLADILVTPGMIDRTVAVWSPMIGRDVTREEAHSIIVDMSIFLRYLLRWDQIARKSIRDNDEDLAQAA
jgi:hypothetical protein